jgi:putative ABC transport system substrate-binding protein
MKRRTFIAGLGSTATAVAWPHAARAQQPTLPVVAFLSTSDPATSPISDQTFGAFERGLLEAGYVKGRNVTIEYDSANGQTDRLPSLVAAAIRRRVAVIVVTDTPGARAAKVATQSVPVVFLIGQDPVDIGLVPSLNGSGTNLTGVSILNTALIGKRVQLMKELLPDITTMAALADPTNAGIMETYAKEAEPAASNLGVHLVALPASSPSEINAAFESLADQKVGALLVTGHLSYMAERDRMISLASRYRMPVIYAYKPFAAAGGLMSYGPSLSEPWRIVGNYTGRVLKDDKPANLPIQQITRVELVINMKTAKALGLTFPLSMLGRADEAIE